MTAIWLRLNPSCTALLCAYRDGCVIAWRVSENYLPTTTGTITEKFGVVFPSFFPHGKGLYHTVSHICISKDQSSLATAAAGECKFFCLGQSKRLFKFLYQSALHTNYLPGGVASRWTLKSDSNQSIITHLSFSPSGEDIYVCYMYERAVCVIQQILLPQTNMSFFFLFDRVQIDAKTGRERRRLTTKTNM